MSSSEDKGVARTYGEPVTYRDRTVVLYHHSSRCHVTERAGDLIHECHFNREYSAAGKF